MLKRCCQFFSLFMVGILLFIPLFTSFVTAEEAEDKIDYSNLTPNQYMSKILLNYNYAGSASPLDGNNKTIPQLQLEFCKTPSKASTARFLCNELSKNDNFMKSVAAWEVLTFDPSEAYEEVENEIDYYIAILLSILDIQMNDNKFIEAWNCSANKTVMSLSKSINGVIESWHDIDVQYWGDLDVSELTDEQFNEVIDAFESASETKKLYTMLGNNLNIINLASNGLKSIKDIVETVAVYSQIAELGTVIDDVLGELYLNCRNNTAMGLAVAKVKEAFNENINSTVVSIFETSNELVKTGFKQGVGMVWDIALTGVLGSFGTAFKYGQAIGKAISNFCFSTDAVIEQFFALNAVTKFEDVLITSINSLASKYMNNESEANADKFMKAVELLFSVYDLGYDYTFDFVYTVNMSGIYNQIKSSYGKNETVESYRSCISSIRNSMDFIKNSITCLEGYRWYYEVDAPSGYEKYFTLTEESVVSTPPYSATKEVVYIQPMSIPEIDSGALLTYTLKNDKRIIITGCNPSAVGTLNIPKAIGGFAVREIASSAFANCTGITEVTMPSTLRTIDYRAFENCSNLTNVILNEGLKTIGDRAFSGTAITEITVPSTVENLVTTSVPADSAFYGANNLKTVVFADGMLAIPVNALKNNMSVVEVSIPNSVTTIGNNAFYGCTEMIDISIPNSVTHIGSQAFYGCIALTEMIVPDSITKIDYRAFENCSNLTSVILNEGLKTIGDRAFSGTAITEITVPSTVENLVTTSVPSDSAFYGANNLKTVVFADGMLAIPANALKNNMSVVEVSIPNSVTTIGNNAFYGCTGLTDVYYAQTEKNWTYVTINSNNTPLLNATMHYNHNAITPTYKATYYVDSSVYAQYDIAKNDPVTIPDAPQKTGYTFTNWSTEIPSVMPNYDLSFFAMWKINKYSVKYIVDGEIYKEYTFSYGFEVATPSTPVKDGYAFAGWDKEIPDTMPAEDLVFEATWVKIGSDEVAYTVETYYMLPDGSYLEVPDELDVYTTVSGIKVSFAPPVIEGFEVDTENSVLSAMVAADGLTVLKVYYSRSVYSDHSHSYYPKVIVDATAYESGAILYSCYCGEQYTHIIPALGFIPVQTTSVVYGENMIYGLQAGCDSLDNCTTIVVDGYQWDYTPGKYGFGTGTKATLTDGENVLGEYTILIFGDVNGDGWYDGEDAFLVNLIVQGILDEDDVGTAIWTAADCNHDGVIDEADVDLLNGAGLLLNNVDQSATPAELEENAAYIEYMGLIDQNFSIGTDNSTAQPDNETTASEFDFEIIIAEVFEFIKSILVFIFSFIV